MAITKWQLATLLASTLSMTFTSVFGQSGNNLPVNEATHYKGEEFLLIGNANRGAGEPVIALDPHDADTIFVGAMASLNYVEGEPISTSFETLNWNNVLIYANTPDASVAKYAISHDGGRTWLSFEDPFRDYFKMNRIADACVGIGKDGTLFIAAMDFFPQNVSRLVRSLELEPSPGLLYGNTGLSSSKDGGKTWSTPVAVMGQATPLEEYGPGVKPVFRGKTPYDRPFIAIDQSTGTLYIPGSGTGGSPSHTETFIRASHDNGKTFGLIYTYDSVDYPQSGLAARPATANGVLAAAYLASSAPQSTGAKCPCIVFGLSRDEGKTFDRHVVQANMPLPKGWLGMDTPELAADASHPGRFAIMSLAGGRAEMEIFVTNDYGKTWKAPVKAGSTPGAIMIKPDIAYSPRGELAVMWRAMKPDQSYTTWSAISRDGGDHFSQPLEVSSGPSPARAAIKDRGNNWDGDDLSSVAVDNEFVHIVWADGRAGFLGTWYARVPIASY